LVAVADRRQFGAVRARVDETIGAGVVGLQHRMGGQRPIAVHALAHGNTLARRPLDRRKPPHRHDAPTVSGGEEAPVLHRVAEHRTGDVIGGEGEPVDACAHLPGFDRRVGVERRKLRLRQVVAADEETLSRRHRCHCARCRNAPSRPG
jgi:hypothetical protein